MTIKLIVPGEESFLERLLRFTREHPFLFLSVVASVMTGASVVVMRGDN